MKKGITILFFSVFALSTFSFSNSTTSEIGSHAHISELAANELAAKPRVPEPWAAGNELAAKPRVPEPWAAGNELAAKPRVPEPWANNKQQT